MQLQGAYDKFTGLNAEILAIAVDDLSSPRLAATVQGFPFPILYNVEGDVARAYGVYNQSAGYANPAVFIVDASGSVAWKHIAPAYPHRTALNDIIAQLERIS